MCSLEQFKIDLKALTDEVTPLRGELDDQFFSMLDSADLVRGGALHVSGSIRKANGFFQLDISIDGTVTVTCDRCLEPMQLPVSTQASQVVRMAPGGEQLQQDDIVTVDEDDPVLDTAWIIYENVALAIPIQHMHQPGDCNAEMMKMLKEHSTARSSNGEDNANDPRWDALKGLLNNT